MPSRRFVLCAVLLAAVTVFAASKVPLDANFLPNLSTTGAGISDDGSSLYANGVAGVQCYFGVNGKNVDLVTYGSGRKLHFIFNPASTAWQSSGLPADFYAEVDFYGVNYFGPYESMGDGTTAQVQASLQFHVGKQTYELTYPALAAYRTGNTWLITSNPYDIPGYPGFTASDQATLSLKRQRQTVSFGSVNMPIRFQATPQ